MPPKSPDNVRGSQTRQGQIDELQRGKRIERALYETTPGNPNTLTFDLSRVGGIQQETRDEIEKALGGQAGINRFVNRVRNLDDDERNLELHKFADDVGTNTAVAEKFLEENEDIKDELERGMKEDFEAPIDWTERPDALLYVRALMFAVDVDANPPADYEDRLNEKRLDVIRQAAGLPDDGGSRKLQTEKDEFDRQLKKAKSTSEFFEESKLMGFETELQKKSTGPEGVMGVYKKLGELTTARAAKTDDQLTKDIAKAKAQVKSIEKQMGVQPVAAVPPAGGGPVVAPATPPPNFGALQPQLESAEEDLAVAEKAQKERDELIKAIENRPKTEADQRGELLKACSRVENIFAELNGLSAPQFNLPAAAAVNININGTPTNVNFTAFPAFIGRLRANKFPNNEDTAPTNDDYQFAYYYSHVLKPWLDGNVTENGETKKRSEWLQIKYQNKANEVKRDSDRLEGKLDRMKSKRESKKSDEAFNINLHYILAREDDRFDNVSRKDLRRDIQINLLADVTDLEENGRIGDSFDPDRVGIYTSIDDAQRNRFYYLVSAKWNKGGEVEEPFKDEDIDIRRPGAINNALINKSLSFAQGVRIYAILSMIGQKDHTETQMIRRTLYERLFNEEGRDGARKLADYVAQARRDFEGFEADDTRSEWSHRFVDWRRKRLEKKAKRHKARAGKMTAAERLAVDADEEDSTLSVGQIIGGYVRHGYDKVQPKVLGVGRDVGKWGLSNAWSGTKATASTSWDITKAVPGKMKEGALHLWQNKTINPIKIGVGTVRASFRGLGFGIKAPFRLTGSVWEKYQYQTFEEGEDLQEKNDRLAQEEEAAAANYQKVSNRHYHEKTNEYEWESFKWDDEEGSTAVKNEKEAPKRPEKKKKKSKKKPSKSGGDSNATAQAA